MSVASRGSFRSAGSSLFTVRGEALQIKCASSRNPSEGGGGTSIKVLMESLEIEGLADGVPLGRVSQSKRRFAGSLLQKSTRRLRNLLRSRSSRVGLKDGGEERVRRFWLEGGSDDEAWHAPNHPGYSPGGGCFYRPQHTSVRHVQKLDRCSPVDTLRIARSSIGGWNLPNRYGCYWRLYSSQPIEPGTIRPARLFWPGDEIAFP